MRRINKLTSLMLAMIMMVSFMMPGGVYEVFAEEAKENKNIHISEVTVLPKGELSKGDKVDVRIEIGFSGFENKEEEKDAFSKLQVYCEGALSDDDAKWTPLQLPGNENKEKNILGASGITYNGKGNSFKLEVGFQDENEWIGTEKDCTLEKVEEILGVKEALEIVNNSTINVVAGETQQISFKLKNGSDNKSSAGEMKLEMKDKNSTSKGIEIKNKRIDIPEMAKGATKEFNVTLAIDKDVTRGIHELKVDIGGKEQIIKLKVDSDFMPPSLAVTVSGTEDFKANVPKNVTINMKNVGNVAARNVKVEVISDKVYVMDGSNVRYVESISSQSSQSLNIKLQISDTTATTVPVQLKLSYTDDLGEKKEDSQIIYLTTTNVAVDTELNIENIIEPTGTYKVGNEFVTKFTVSGKGNIKNVKISV
ncbi:MAG: hypothetical protein RRY26_10305, partial [Cellulosilyticaceae bacterium]